MVDSVKTSSPNRFFNKYVEYRKQYDQARNFDKALATKESDKPKVDTGADKKPAAELAKADASSSKPSTKSLASNPPSADPVSTGSSGPSAATGGSPNVIPTAPAAYTSSAVPNVGAASNRMMDKVKEYEPHIRAAAARYGIDPNWIAGVIWQESRGNPRAVSHCGAMGLMQLMPGTARHLGVGNAFDIGQNIDGGAKYLRQMLDTFKGNMSHATAAYNAGPGNVMKHGGIPPFRETQDYVPKVLGYANGFKVADAFQDQGQTSAIRV